MKKIGLIGGVGWPSTLDYYRIINIAANEKFGSLESPEIIVYSVNFEPLKKLQYQNKWSETALTLGKAAQSLEKAGADFALICSVTTNIPYKEVQSFVNIPIIGIVEPVATAIAGRGLKKIGLLGTKATMEHAFFRSGLAEFGLETIVPYEYQRAAVHQIIYDELCFNKICAESKKKFFEIIESLRTRGAEGIILGCTEIPLLVSEKDIPIPAFDVTRLHAMEALRLSLS